MQQDTNQPGNVHIKIAIALLLAMGIVTILHVMKFRFVVNAGSSVGAR